MKKAYLKTVQTDITQTIDKTTGELIDISTRKINVLVKDKEEFFFVYSQILGVLESILKGPELGILSLLMFKYMSPSGSVTINESSKKEICTKLNISKPSVNRAIKSLVESDVLIHPMKGSYSINPNYVWKGTTSTRNEKLKLDLSITTEKSESFF